MSQNYVAAQTPSQLPTLVAIDPTLPAPTLLGLSQHMPDGSIDTLGAGRTTADTHPILVFISVPGDTYTLYDNGVLIGTMTAANSVTGWTLPSLDNGSHALTLTYTSTDGVSLPLQVQFNVAATPSAPVITDIHAGYGPLEGTVAAGGVSTDSHPAINGTGQAGDTINVFDGSTLLGSTSIDANGHWSFTPANALANGGHTITVTETNSAGTSAASAAYPLDVANIMITAVHDANGHLVANGGTTAGAIQITGWISDPSVISDGLLVAIGGGNLGYTSRIMGANFTVTGHTFTVELSGNSFTGGVGDGAFPTNGTFTIGVEAFGSAGHIATALDPQLLYTITDNFNAVAQQVSATLAAAVTDTSHHVALGEHDAFTATTSHATIDLNVDPAAYFAQATAHVQGASGAANTVHLTGDHQVLDLTSLSGHTAASKISGVEAVDLGGAHNTLKLSLSDVLNLGQSDMFQQDGHIQMLVKGSNGDSVDLSNAHIAGITNGQWTQEGASVIGGVTYNVYEHSGAHAELLVQQGVQIALHA